MSSPPGENTKNAERTWLVGMSCNPKLMGRVVCEGYLIAINATRKGQSRIWRPQLMRKSLPDGAYRICTVDLDGAW